MRFQYLSTATLVAGVKASELHQGHYHANQYNYLEVIPPRIAFALAISCRSSVIGQCLGSSLHQTCPSHRPREHEPSCPWRRRCHQSLRREGMEGTCRRGRRPRRFASPISQHPNHQLTHFPLATLKDDDVEDSDDEPDETDTLARESKALRSRQPVAVKQPTGRVVGIIKRNWRASVSPLTGLPISPLISHQLRLPHRQHLPHLDPQHLPRPPNRLCHPRLPSAPSYPHPDPPSARAPRPKDPCHHRRLGHHLTLPHRPLRPRSRQGREQGSRAGESPPRIRGPLPSVWKGYPRLLARRGRALGCPAQGRGTARVAGKGGFEGVGRVQH